MRAIGGELRLAIALRALPVRVAWFIWRARLRARRAQDRFSLDSAARPAELAELLRLARGRTAVVELGTGTAWSTIALALADRGRRVISYDPCAREAREAYLRLVPDSVRERIELRELPDWHGPGAGDVAVELLFVDSEHERDPLLAAFRAWREALAPDGMVVFHDYDHPSYPGVRDGILELGLSGRISDGLFVWDVQ